MRDELESRRAAILANAVTPVRRSEVRPVSAVILDVDGTLVDSNYQHILAWQRAFAEYQVSMPAWRVHRHMGMGGDQLVESLAGPEVEATHGDGIRAAESGHYADLMFEVRPLEGAAATIEHLVESGFDVVLASSAKKSEVSHYVKLIGAHPGPHACTDSDEVERTKPEPDLVQRALAEVGARPDEALLVGDSPWDISAAGSAGVPSIGVRTGGFPDAELRELGAGEVLETVSDLPDLLKDKFRAGELAAR
jgi:phosphoglycolate phosphatase-like HAD superfamily hydrolase